MNILGGQLTSISSYEHLGGSAHKIIAPMGFFLCVCGGERGVWRGVTAHKIMAPMSIWGSPHMVSEILMSESLNRQTDGRWLESHPISSPGVFGSDKIK